VLLDTIPGVAKLLALTTAIEVGEISRFASPEKLVSYGRVAPRLHPSGQGRPGSGPLSKSGSRLLAGRRSKPRARPGANRTLARTLTSTSAAAPAPQLRQGRGRAQDPDRRLAPALPQRTLQARPEIHRWHVRPGELPLGLGRPTALMGLRSRDSSHRRGVSSQRQGRAEHPTVREYQRRVHRTWRCLLCRRS
jgi:hypothetical protein